MRYAVAYCLSVSGLVFAAACSDLPTQMDSHESRVPPMQFSQTNSLLGSGGESCTSAPGFVGIVGEVHRSDGAKAVFEHTAHRYVNVDATFPDCPL